MVTARVGRIRSTARQECDMITSRVGVESSVRDKDKTSVHFTRDQAGLSSPVLWRPRNRPGTLRNVQGLYKGGSPRHKRPWKRLARERWRVTAEEWERLFMEV